MSKLKVEIKTDGVWISSGDDIDISIPFSSPIEESEPDESKNEYILLYEGVDFTSSSINKIYYNAFDKVLGIEFNSNNLFYLYKEIPLSTFVELIISDSKGYTVGNIRSTYGEHYAKIPASEFLDQLNIGES